MKNNLIKSAIVVFIFWWLLATGFWLYQNSGFASNYNFFDLINPLSEQLKPVQYTSSKWYALSIFLRNWTLPLIVLQVPLAALAFQLSEKRIKADRVVMENKLTPEEGDWRGVKITLGKLPKPPVNTESHPIEVELPETIVEQASEAEKFLIFKLFSLIYEHRDHICDLETKESLFDQTLNYVEEIFESQSPKPEVLIFRLLLQIGLIRQFVKKESAISQDKSKVWPFNAKASETVWEKSPLNLRKCTLMMMSSLEEWWALPAVDRTAYSLAISYQNKPDLLPYLSDEDPSYLKAKALLELKSDLKEKAAVKQAESDIQKLDDPQEIVYQEFLEVLATSVLQQPGTPRSVKAIGWKRDGLLFLLEDQIRIKLKEKLDPHFMTGLKKLYPKKPSLASTTVCLLDYFHKKGLLITEKDGVVTKPDRALFKITAGKSEFNGVMILVINEDMLARCPNFNTSFEIKILESFFKGVDTAEDTKLANDELGSLFKPKSVENQEEGQDRKSSGAISKVVEKVEKKSLDKSAPGDPNAVEKSAQVNTEKAVDNGLKGEKKSQSKQKTNSEDILNLLLKDKN